MFVLIIAPPNMNIGPSTMMKSIAISLLVLMIPIVILIPLSHIAHCAAYKDWLRSFHEDQEVDTTERWYHRLIHFRRSAKTSTPEIRSSSQLLPASSWEETYRLHWDTNEPRWKRKIRYFNAVLRMNIFFEEYATITIDDGTSNAKACWGEAQIRQAAGSMWKHGKDLSKWLMIPLAFYPSKAGRNVNDVEDEGAYGNESNSILLT